MYSSRRGDDELLGAKGKESADGGYSVVSEEEGLDPSMVKGAQRVMWNSSRVGGALSGAGWDTAVESYLMNGVHLAV